MTLSYPADAAILIGRFQPFHNGHAGLLQKALATSGKRVWKAVSKQATCGRLGKACWNERIPA